MDEILGLRMSCAATVVTQVVATHAGATQQAMTSAARLQTRNVALRRKMMATRGNSCSQYCRPDQGCQGETALRAWSQRTNLASFTIMRARANLKHHWNHDVVKERQILEISPQQTCLANI